MQWKSRLQEVVPVALAARSSLRRLIRHTWLEREENWQNKYYDIIQGTQFDLQTAFFAQCAAQGYSTIIEVGAADGHRITALKSIFRDARAIALDIGRRYQRRFTAYDVEFFSLKQCPELFPERSIVISVGTLSYMSADDLLRFIEFLAERRCSLAYFEPMPWWSITKSVRRRINGGWYHPYRNILSAAGYASMLGKKWSHLASHITLERWDYDYVEIEHDAFSLAFPEQNNS